MRRWRLALLGVLAAAIAAYFVFGLDRYLALEYFDASRERIEAFRDARYGVAALGFVSVYIAVAALSLPGAALMTLVGGALFGVVVGTVLASFASTIGATLAFMASRFLFRDWAQRLLGDRLATLDKGIARDGAFYLFALRLVPLFPFWLVNLAMGLTRIPARTFYWVSQLGMLPATILYVYAGTQLGEFRVSLGLVVALVLLGFFPLATRSLLATLRARKAYAHWLRPARFQYDMVVIGGGSSGLVSAYIAAVTRAKVALVEKHAMGGDCLNTGCVPSKALIRTAKLLAQIRRSRELGIAHASVRVDFADVMERVARVVRTVAPHDSIERYTALGVHCIAGEARITSPWTVEVGTGADRRSLTTRNIVIAAGARPFVPPIPGLDEVGCLTSDNLWSLRELPARLVVLGGGPIGSELAQAFARLGSAVTQVEMLPRLLTREDPDVSEWVRRRLESDGVRVLTGHRASRFLIDGGEKVLLAESAGQQVRIAFDQVLVAVGRVANTRGYGLEELGIGVTPAHTVETDDFLQTLYPNIYACGDVAGPYQFTHAGAHQAWYAVVNALFGSGLKRWRVDYRAIPWTTFTDPEVARVGLNEQEAKEKGIACRVSVYDLAELDRAIADGTAHGFVKVLTRPGSDQILGATIVGEHAGDLLAEYVLAMSHGLGLGTILGTVHSYPTYAEANKYAAGIWKRSTVTRGQEAFLSALHAWRRGELGFSRVLRNVGGLLRDKRPARVPANPT